MVPRDSKGLPGESAFPGANVYSCPENLLCVRSHRGGSKDPRTFRPVPMDSWAAGVGGAPAITGEPHLPTAALGAAPPFALKIAEWPTQWGPRLPHDLELLGPLGTRM